MSTPDREAPSPELLRVHQAGTALSNIAFNLAQRPGDPLTSDYVQALDGARREWDAACAAFKARRIEMADRAAAVPAGMVLVPTAFVRGFNTLAHNWSLPAEAPDYYSGVERDAFADAYARCGADLAKLGAMLAAAAGDAKPATQGDGS